MEVKADQNAEQGQENAYVSAVIQQITGWIDWHDVVCRQNERPGDQQDLGDEQGKSANRHEDSK